MVKFILNEAPNPSPEQLKIAVKFLKKNGIALTDFDKDDKWSVLNQLLKVKFGCGESIPLYMAESISSRFGGGDSPRSFTVSEELVTEFCKRVQDFFITPRKVPTGHELGIRFHVGKDASDKYNVIMVPICGPESDCISRDHTGEFENKLFSLAGQEWFGLAFSELDSGVDGRFVTNQQAKTLLAKVDESSVKVVYFLYQRFLSFLPKPEEYSLMLLKFGRTGIKKPPTAPKDQLTLMYIFLDKRQHLKLFKDPDLFVKLMGVYIDQGDLMPPPDVPDTNINP